MSVAKKNLEKLNIWATIQQAEDNAEDRHPVVVIKRNGTKVYAVLEFEQFLTLIGEKKDDNQKR